MRIFNISKYLISFLSLEFLILIVSIGIVIFLLIIFLMVYPTIKKRKDFKNFQNNYYKVIRKIADMRDYYLINNLTIKNNNKLLCKIDHVLFGDKFIYVIKDRYYRGAISGEKNDNTWLFHTRKKEKQEMANPMFVNNERLEKLSYVTQIDKSFFVSIVVINDNCVISNDTNELSSENSFIVAISKLPRLIKLVESRNVKKMNENQLKKAVEDIYRLYGKGEKNEV